MQELATSAGLMLPQLICRRHQCPDRPQIVETIHNLDVQQETRASIASITCHGAYHYQAPGAPVPRPHAAPQRTMLRPASWGYALAKSKSRVHKTPGRTFTRIPQRSRSRGRPCCGAPPAAPPASADGRDGCMGPVCVTHARPLDRCVDGRR